MNLKSECTCRTSVAITREPVNSVEIEYCNLHRAAPALVAALEQIAGQAHKYARDYAESTKPTPTADQLRMVLGSISQQVEQALAQSFILS